MKVVLFCGGLGMRMRDGVTTGPKPMALVGERPLLWHVMRYYAHFGHTDFVLCLGYGASAVKDFFLNYDETRSNDFVLERGTHEPTLFRTDISDWQITFVDTGSELPDRRAPSTGPSLRRRRVMFMANYAGRPHRCSVAGHGRAFHREQRCSEPPGRPSAILASCGGHRRRRTDHGRHADAGSPPLGERRLLHLQTGDFRRAERGRRPGRGRARQAGSSGSGHAYPYKGYWSPADTVKERAQLDERYHRADCPWMIWDPERSGACAELRRLRRPCAMLHKPPSASLSTSGLTAGHASSALERPAGRALSLLAVGAHPDDIEIGAGGTLLTLAESCPGLRVRYVVSPAPRNAVPRPERRSAFLPGADVRLELHHLPEGRLPAVWDRVKDVLEGVACVVDTRRDPCAFTSRRPSGPSDDR